MRRKRQDFTDPQEEEYQEAEDENLAEEEAEKDGDENPTAQASETQEYEVVEREILPAKIICPECGGITMEGLEFCDKCGGELQ